MAKSRFLWSFREGFFSNIESSDSEDGLCVGIGCSVFYRLLRECVLVVGWIFFLRVLRAGGNESVEPCRLFPCGVFEAKMSVGVPVVGGGERESSDRLTVAAVGFVADVVCVVGVDVVVTVLGGFSRSSVFFWDGRS